VGLFGIVFAILAGAANPFQSATNAELNKQLAQPAWSGLTVYATGLMGMAIVLAVARQPFPAGKLNGVPWWGWMGGLISILSTMAGLMLAQKMGSAMFTGLTLTASVITSVLLDHFGLVGMRQHTASPARVLGCGLLIAGIWLVAKF
jgi:transporter family-2 protein